MKLRTIRLKLHSQVAVIWLNRATSGNAINEILIDELGTVYEALDSNSTVRAVVMAGEGSAFCSGFDLNWLKKLTDAGPHQYSKGARKFAQLLQRIDRFGKPVVTRVHGAVAAAGLGLIAASDIVFASMDATFCIPETRLGQVPAVAAPYMLRAIGTRHARRYLLSGETFTAAEAYRIGLVHELAPIQELDSRINETLGHLLMGGPEAMKNTKQLIGDSGFGPIEDQDFMRMISLGAEVGTSAEGKDGIAANLEGRSPKWMEHPPRPRNRKSGGPKR